MRILIATSDYPPAVGGMAEYSAAWASGLRDLGIDVRVLARDNQGAGPSRSKPSDGQNSIADESAERVRWTPGPLRDPFNAYHHLRRHVEEFRPHLVMAHTWIGWAPALDYLKGKTGVRTIVSAHGAEVVGPASSPYYRFLMRQGFKGANRVFAVSSFTAGHVAALGISRERIDVIGNGVDLRRFTPGLKSPSLLERYGLKNSDVIVTVGGLVDRKGHDIVIEAMALLKDLHPRLKYVIAGGWSLRSSREEFLRDLVSARGLEQRVIFTGFLESDALPAIYRLADIFVMTGREVKDRGWVEGFGISYLEAAACALPIIATDTGGVSEAVTTDNAVFVPAENPRATADAIVKLLDDNAERNRMASASLDWARKNSWADRVKAGAEIMEKIVA